MQTYPSFVDSFPTDGAFMSWGAFRISAKRCITIRKVNHVRHMIGSFSGNIAGTSLRQSCDKVRYQNQLLAIICYLRGGGQLCMINVGNFLIGVRDSAIMFYIISVELENA